MPDDRYNGPRTDDLWPSADGSSGHDPWAPSYERPASNDSWASDLWVSNNDLSTDTWAPSADAPAADASTNVPWTSDLWASTSESSGDTWMSGVDAPSTESPAGAPWVSEVWASTEPSPWVSDLWASTDPSTAGTDEWPATDEPSSYADPQAPVVDAPVVDEPSAADPGLSVSEPFWRSESWLLEPLTDETQAVDLSGDADAESVLDWPQPTEAAVEWGDLGEGSEGTWSSYQRELDSPADDPAPTRPAPRPATIEASTNASDFASQRGAMAPAPPTKGLPGFMYKLSAGHLQMKPTKDEQVRRDSTRAIRRSIAGLRQITFTNPKGGSGKTTAALLTSMTLGQLRGGYVLAWDNNETQGTLGVRARRDDHANTVRDLIADLPSFSGPVAGRVGDLAKYVRSQGDAMFDILASDEQAEAGEMMTAAAFQAVREVVGRFYKLICVDTGNNVRAANWAASIDSTDQLVVSASVRWESAYSASRMLDYLEQSGRGDLVSNAVTVLTMPASMKGLNLAQVEDHFGVRTREVLCTPFDEQLDNGDEINFDKLNPATRRAWLQIGAAIVRGL